MIADHVHLHEPQSLGRAMAKLVGIAFARATSRPGLSRGQERIPWNVRFLPRARGGVTGEGAGAALKSGRKPMGSGQGLPRHVKKIGLVAPGGAKPSRVEDVPL